VALRAQEPGIGVVLSYVVRHDVVVPGARVPGEDPPREVGERDVGITLNPPVVGEGVVVPLLRIGNGVVLERSAGGDREHIAHAGPVVHLERHVRGDARHLVLPPSADEALIPRLTRKQHADATVGVDPQKCDVGVLGCPEEDADGHAGHDGILAAVRPDGDGGTMDGGGEQETEETRAREHGFLHEVGSRSHANTRPARAG
jgi:hypothetical protein